jgi:hypothetical protein
LTVEFARSEGAPIEFAVETLFNNPQVGGARKVISPFGRDMINVGDPHQIASLFDTFDHNIRLILNG